MAKKKKKQHSSPPAEVSNESRASIAVTVFWLLCVLTTTTCTLIAGGLLWYYRSQAVEPEGVTRIFVLLMHFSAVVSAVLTLTVTYAVYRIRVDAPPRAITIFAIVVSLLPLAALVVFR